MIQTPQDERSELIKQLYRRLFDREADETGLNHWYHSKLSIDELEVLFKESNEYRLKKIIASQRSNIKNPVYRSVSNHIVQPIHGAIKEAFQLNATDWKGSLNIYMPGKTGEILFLLGYFPYLRKMIPKAKIIFHTLPFYIDVIRNVPDGPDHIESIAPMCSTLADSVNAAILSKPIAGFEIQGSDLWVSPFRLWGRYSSNQNSNPGPFYRLFADAIGVIPNNFEKTIWIPSKAAGGMQRIALALPTSNQNASIRRTLPFTASQWENLADSLRERGLDPLTTGHRDDPLLPSMPGWTRMDSNLIHTITMILDAEYLVSFSTGLAFAAASFGKARVVIIDELNEKYTSLRYGVKSLNDAIDTNRLWAIFTPPDGSRDKEAYELASEVASQPSLIGGYSIGYPA